MYRLVIADDEALILQGLRNVVDWTSIGFQVTGCYENGDQVLSHMAEDCPDAILADIKMPIMDGLTMLKRIRASGNRETEIVFLTGYDDFDLIQSAIRLGAQDYVLKPSSVEELMETFSKVRERLDARFRKAERDLQIRASLSWAEAARSAMNIVFSRNKKQFDRYWSVAAQSLIHGGEEAPWSMIMLTTESAALSRICGAKDVRDLEKLKKDVETFESAEEGVIACANRFYTVLVFKEADAKRIEMTLKQLQHHTSAQIRSCWENGSESLWIAHSHLYRQLFVPEISPSLASLCYAADNDMVFSAALEDNNGNIARWCLQAGFARIQDIAEPYRSHLLMRMLNVLSLSFLDSKPQEEKEIGLLFERIEAASFDAAKRWMLSFVSDHYEKEEDSISVSRHQHLCMEIAKYIQENYAEEITLNELSQRFFISPNYLGSLFRRTIGSGIRDYQTSIRIERADQLIATHQFRLYQIAEMVGYKNYEHFRKTYVKVRGRNPSE